MTWCRRRGSKVIRLIRSELFTCRTKCSLQIEKVVVFTDHSLGFAIAKLQVTGLDAENELVTRQEIESNLFLHVLSLRQVSKILQVPVSRERFWNLGLQKQMDEGWDYEISWCLALFVNVGELVAGA